MYFTRHMALPGIPPAAEKLMLKDDELRLPMITSGNLSYETKKDLVSSKLSLQDTIAFCSRPLPEDLIKILLGKEKRMAPLSQLIASSKLSAKDQTKIYEMFPGKNHMVVCFLNNPHTDLDLSRRILSEHPSKQNRRWWLRIIASQHLSDDEMISEIALLGRITPERHQDLQGFFDARATSGLALKFANKKKLTLAEASALLISVHAGVLPLEDIISKTPKINFQSESFYLLRAITGNPFINPTEALSVVKNITFAVPGQFVDTLEQRIKKGYFSALPQDLTYDLFKAMEDDKILMQKSMAAFNDGLKSLGIDYFPRYRAGKPRLPGEDFSEVVEAFKDAGVETWQTIFMFIGAHEGSAETFIAKINALS